LEITLALVLAIVLAEFALVACDGTLGKAEDTPVASVAVSPSTLALTAEGASGTLTAMISPDNATNKAITWTTSDAAIASVGAGADSATGLVTAVGAGAAVITATTVDGKNTASCSVTVAAAALSVDTTAPANPASPTAVATNAQVALGWTNPADSDFAGVEISWTPTGGSPAQPLTVAKPGTSQTIAGLASGTSYTFTIKAVDGKGNASSGASVSVSIGTTTSLAVSVLIHASAEAPATMSVPSTIAKGSALAFTVSETFDSYQWYLDGTASVTTKSGSIDTAALSPGLHELSLFAMKDGELTTKSCRFTVSN